jgi:hypothetical protein
MVRRTVYDTVGLFDPRLANLPDFDMWVRLCMNFDIFVSPDQVTAMRILDGNRNMSAPKHDSLMRSNFEHFKILDHYKKLSIDAVRNIFEAEIAKGELGDIHLPRQLLAELAVTFSFSPVQRCFGLESMFDEIPNAGDQIYRRFYELTGNLDIFGVVSAEELRDIKNEMKAAQARIADLNDAAADLASGIKDRETEIARLSGFVNQLSGSLSLEQADKARLEKVIELAEIETEGLQKSKTYAWLKLQKSFRRRIERLAELLRQRGN